MALALVLGMSQCKKQETPTNGNGGDMVYITLNVSNSESLAVNVDNNGSRHDMSPRLGMVKFENGDVLHVGYNHEYIGQLTYQDGAFGGTLPAATTGVTDNLHFYFLGGKGINENSPAVGDASFGFSIADQSAKLPVLCYGASTKPYGSTTNYSAVLEYKCALVRFDLENHVEDYNVTLSGVPTQATVNFASPTATTAIVAAANQTNANMTLYGEPGNAAYRWAILLPETNLNTGHDDLSWEGEGETIPVMANNTYISSGLKISNPEPVLFAPDAEYAVKNSDGVLSQFTVNANGKKVYFSKANLKRTPSSNTWEFHNSQVEECYGEQKYKQYTGAYQGIKQSNYGNGPLIPIYGSSMDRFCWGYYTEPSGPFMDVSSTDYVEGRKDLSRKLETDWGCAFPNTYWRTPTASEWDYLLNNTARGNKRFMLVQFYNSDPVVGGGVKCEGLLLFPDDFVEPVDLHRTWTSPNTGNTLTFFSSTWYNKTDQYYLIDKQTWDSSDDGVCTESNSNMYKLLAAGAVFLPAVGVRSGDGGQYYKYNYYVDYTSNSDFHGQGYYWSASFNGTDRSAQYLWFGIHGSKYQGDGSQPTVTEYVGVNNPNLSRNQGCCVRLVWDAN